MDDILNSLRGGDRRSIGNADEVAAAVLQEPGLFPELFAGLLDDDPVVQMRAADAVEKTTRKRPDLLQPWKRQLLEIVAQSDEKEIRWHVAQMLPRLKLTPGELDHAVQILNGYLQDTSSIVKTFSMQALADLALQEPTLLDDVLPILQHLTLTGTPAMKSRGRKLLKRLQADGEVSS